jgi:hypothetical protein
MIPNYYPVNDGFSFDWPLTIAIIALAVSVLSPVLVTWLNNRYRMKVKQFEFFKIHKAKVIEDYIRSTGAAITNTKSSTYSEFGKNYAEIYLYLDDDLWKYIDNINAQVRRFFDIDKDVAWENLTVLCKELAKRDIRPLR